MFANRFIDVISVEMSIPDREVGIDFGVIRFTLIFLSFTVINKTSSCQ